MADTAQKRPATARLFRLDVPVLDRKGRIRDDGGVVSDAPGMYVLGGNLLGTRRSSYIAGAEQDTFELADHLHGYLDRHARVKAEAC